ncbi:hypothetical protein [Streptomyces fuscichromogenes]|uniref:Uncharacterized protein n=1 Tax=Streptomyces fuscichromogenes TaxID=1324013 RepID=A0A917X946_9ACTN|nr:hypothetical protein [Streptomyces fuscichromogenes]GGM90773.1 hypothetical protein GCM10011578_008330 [Streptomyces fuscichromogenes]
MRRSKRKLRAAVIATASAALLAGTVALAPGASAVTPTWASTSYDCGTLGSSPADLIATQNGTYATITVELPSLTVPLPVQAFSVPATLVLYDINTGASTTFTGDVNPYMAVGDPLDLGWLQGTVTPGSTLDTIGGGLSRLTFVLYGITFNCHATSFLFPGPYQF